MSPPRWRSKSTFSLAIRSSARFLGNIDKALRPHRVNAYGPPAQVGIATHKRTIRLHLRESSSRAGLRDDAIGMTIEVEGAVAEETDQRDAHFFGQLDRERRRRRDRGQDG